MIEGIRVRILFAVLLPLLILALILGLYFISVRVEDAHANLEIRGQNLGRYLGAASEFNLLSGNVAELQEFADNQFAISNLLTALVFLDSDGSILSHRGEKEEINNLLGCFYNINTCDQYRNRLYFSSSIYSSGVSLGENPEINPEASASARERLGNVVFFFDTKPLSALQQKMLYDGLVITAAAALLVALISFAFANGITRPIIRLSRVVSRIQRGDLAARTRPSGRGELLELERGINAMAAKVEQANENLQQKVEQATQDLLLTLAQLKVKNKDLEDARKKAESAGRVKDLFLAKMSHELRTPLASIIGYLKLMEEAEDATQRRTYGKIVDQASGILLATIDDILDFMRVEGGEVRLERIEFFLRDCLHNVVALQKPEANRKRLQLECLIDESVPEIAIGDPARLAQVVTNLLSNAIKFTDEGDVRLGAMAKLTAAGQIELQVVVKDTGIGIAKDKQALLFEPFVQAEDSINRRYGGSGLGLAITRRLVKAMGGEISLLSDAGCGVEITFTVRLARAQGGLREIDPEPRPAAHGTAVLLVEDNELNRQLLRLQLEAKGVSVSCAEDGERAIELATAEQGFDFVLMDVHLPGMDGIALAPRLRQLLPRTPIYALTANITGSEEQTLLRTGVERIFYKPLNEATLKALLQASIDQLPLSQSLTARGEPGGGESKLVLPKGIKDEEVHSEFKQLLLLARQSFAERDWDKLLEIAHTLLGSARMFTSGGFANLVVELEAGAREQDPQGLQDCLAQIQKEMDSMFGRL